MSQLTCLNQNNKGWDKNFPCQILVPKNAYQAHPNLLALCVVELYAERPPTLLLHIYPQMAMQNAESATYLTIHPSSSRVKYPDPT